MATFTGTNGVDIITPWHLSPGITGPANEKPSYDADTIYGLGGNDILDGGGTGGELHGGAGNDTLNGYADSGTISLYGDGGDDHLRVKSDDGDPRVLLYGGDDNDTLEAASDYNNAPRGVGDNTLSGGGGNDAYVVFSGAEKVVETAGNGTDTVKSWADFSLPDNVENLTLLMTEYVSYENFRATGNNTNNVIRGNSEDNLIDGLAGNDTIYGRSVGLPQRDIYGDAHSDADLVHGGAGNDTIYGGDGKLTWDGADRLYGDAGNDVLHGQAGADHLYGGDGYDRLYGDAGDDVLNGGPGRDVLSGGDGHDAFAYTAIAESPAGGQRDEILDFIHGGASGDRIDLSDVDANSAAGFQPFTFVAGALTGAGQVCVIEAASGTASVVQGEVDGKAGVDFSILVQDGADHGAKEWTAADFILV